MKIAELQEKILRLKKEKGVLILAHSYQRQEVIEIADYVGDSFGLAQQAAKTDAERVLLCGVRFMAETVKLLSPQKEVYLSHSGAGCPMADMIDPDELTMLKEAYPDHKVVAYINTTAAVKAISDVCVTSSSAVRIVKALPEKKILFVPDCNLGAYVAQQVPEKEFHFHHGGCPTHLRLRKEHIEKARREHPNAKFLIHPEASPEVVAMCDFVGSTTEIMDEAIRCPEKEVGIGTERSIAEHLAYLCPEKHFFLLSKDLVCHNMLLTTLHDVLACLEGRGEKIELSDEMIAAARRPIDEMLRLG